MNITVKSSRPVVTSTAKRATNGCRFSTVSVKKLSLPSSATAVTKYSHARPRSLDARCQTSSPASFRSELWRNGLSLQYGKVSQINVPIIIKIGTVALQRHNLVRTG